MRKAVEQHREWFHGILETLLRIIDHPMQGDAADDLMLARDCAMAGGYASDPVAAAAGLSRIYARVIDAAVTRPAAA